MVFMSSPGGVGGPRCPAVTLRFLSHSGASPLTRTLGGGGPLPDLGPLYTRLGARGTTATQWTDSVRRI
jgi:hypothetical protein